MSKPAYFRPEEAARVTDRRSRVERLLDAARALPPSDRALVEQVFARGGTPTQIARAVRQPRWRVARRLRRILRRARHPLFEAAACHFDLLPRDIRPTVRLALFHGLPLRNVARRRRLTIHRVRAHLDLARRLMNIPREPTRPRRAPPLAA